MHILGPNIQLAQSIVAKVQPVPKQGMKNILNGMERGEVLDKNSITVEMIKYTGEAALWKHSVLLTKDLNNGKIPKAWKNTVIVVLLYCKRNFKEMK